MIVKTLQLELHLSQSHSLKDKRKIIKSLITRCRQNFNVSISEIDNLDDIKRSIIAIAIVTNAEAYADRVLDKCLNLIETLYPIEIDVVKRERV